MIKQLVKFFAGPRRSALSSEIIENEIGGSAYIVKSPVVSNYT